MIIYLIGLNLLALDVVAVVLLAKAFVALTRDAGEGPR